MNFKNNTICEVEYLKLGFLKYLYGKPARGILADTGLPIIYTGSGRAALRIVLEYLKDTGVLPDKNSEILVPQWLCQSLLHTLHRFSHPALAPSKKVKVVMAYHQYGFPQDMDEIRGFCRMNNAVLIEDCAHAFESYYKGKRLGTFGEAAIFSFSKFFPSVLGGALAVSGSELRQYALARLEDSKYSNLTYISRLFYELFSGTALSSRAADLQEMAYAKTDRAFKIKDISSRIAAAHLRNGVLERRKRNFEFIINYFRGQPEYFSGLEREGVIPYVLPLFDKDENLEKMKKKLNANNIVTDIYHFDVNRNLLNPRFRRCLWLPVHQGLSLEDVERICVLVKEAV